MYLLLAAVFFGVFATNVAIGSACGYVFLNYVS